MLNVQACEWQAAVQNLKHQLEDQVAETEAWKQKAAALQAPQAQQQRQHCAVPEQSATCEVGCCTGDAGSVTPPELHLAGDPSVNLLRFEVILLLSRRQQPPSPREEEQGEGEGGGGGGGGGRDPPEGRSIAADMMVIL